MSEPKGAHGGGALACAFASAHPSAGGQGHGPTGSAGAANALLGRTTFTALFVASDVLALGAINALREANRRVPDDVSVVGFDDIALAPYFDPPLTTVRLPAFELGQAAGRALLDRIADRAVAQRTLLPTELVVRGSTGPPASHGTWRSIS